MKMWRTEGNANEKENEGQNENEEKEKESFREMGWEGRMGENNLYFHIEVQ